MLIGLQNCNRGIGLLLRSQSLSYARFQSTSTTSAKPITSDSADVIIEGKIEDPVDKTKEPKSKKAGSQRRNRGRQTQTVEEPVEKHSNNPTIQIRKLVGSFTKFHHETTNGNFVAEFEQHRLVPLNPLYFTRNPIHNNNLRKLTEVLNKYRSLVNTNQYDRESKKDKSKSKEKNTKWISLSDYKNATSDRTTDANHKELITILEKLDSISPQFRNTTINGILNKYRGSQVAKEIVKSVKTPDAKGRSIAVGQRKSSRAKVYLVKGEGKILINNEDINDFFPNCNDRAKILRPLEVINCETNFNIFAAVEGGGKTGQSHAISLAIARAIVIHNRLFQHDLQRLGCLTRDHRVVERKKPGKVKARKSPTWVKR